MKIYLIIKNKNPRLENLINIFNLEHDEYSSMALMINSNSLELYDRKNLQKGSVKVDFTSKKNNYRCHSLTRKNEILSKVVGIKKFYYPFVLDVTAGLGNDAFILSFLGCHVVMIERHPVIAALLQDGLHRGYKDKTIGKWLKKRLHFIFNNSINMLQMSITQPDVIYLDPMYPFNKKKCLPKKNMQFFRKLIGYDNDAENLLNMSRKLAKKRIIVKRPRYAKALSPEKVNFIITSKNHRFDVYSPFKKTGVHII